MPGIGAGWKIIHGRMAKGNEAFHIQEIEDYVDGHDKGVTRKAMRFAAGLPVTPASGASADVPPAPYDPVADAMRLMRLNGDLLIGYCLDNDIEYMTDAHCRLATCIPGANPAKRKEYFHKLIDHGFWVKSLKPQGNATQTYIPVVQLSKGLASVFPSGSPCTEGPLGEEINLDELRSAHSNPNRTHNVRLLAAMYSAIMDFKSQGAGRQTRGAKIAFDEADRMIKKLRAREALCQRNIVACSTAAGQSPHLAGEKVKIQASYVTKYDRLCRARADVVGLQGMSNVTQRIANPDLTEIDIEAAAWTILPQIATRIGIQLDHPVASFVNINRYPHDKLAIAEAISPIQT